MTIINRDSKILITGINNKKSVAYSVAKNLQAAGESLFFTAQFPEQLAWIQAQFDTPMSYFAIWAKQLLSPP